MTLGPPFFLLINEGGGETLLIYTLLLYGHIATAIFGFIVSGGLAIAALIQRSRGTLPKNFWIWQTVVQINTLLLAVFGTSLFLMGGRPKVILHILYGAIALLTILVQRAVGTDGAMLEGMWPKKDGRAGVNIAWVAFGLNAFLWAIYGRGLTTGFFGF